MTYFSKNDILFLSDISTKFQDPADGRFKKDILVRGLSKHSFDCHCIATNCNNRTIGNYFRIHSDNMSDKYGFFSALIKRDIANIANKCSYLNETHIRKSPRLWTTRSCHDNGPMNIFFIPKQYGFPAYRFIVAIPFAGRSREHICFIFSSSDPRRDDLLEAVEFIGKLSHQLKLTSKRARQSSNLPYPHRSGNTALGEPELQCLKWIAAGKTMQDISDITGMTYKSVRYHLEKARNKYGFSTMHQTLVQATIDYDLTPYGD